jgi:hypothetical protein
MFLVLVSLVLGIIVMAKGGTYSKKYSNKLMKARVYLQGLAIGLFILAYMSLS